VNLVYYFHYSFEFVACFQFLAIGKQRNEEIDDKKTNQEVLQSDEIVPNHCCTMMNPPDGNYLCLRLTCVLKTILSFVFFVLFCH
jgi:hypothetical protein